MVLCIVRAGGIDRGRYLAYGTGDQGAFDRGGGGDRGALDRGYMVE